MLTLKQVIEIMKDKKDLYFKGIGNGRVMIIEDTKEYYIICSRMPNPFKVGMN